MSDEEGNPQNSDSMRTQSSRTQTDSIVLASGIGLSVGLAAGVAGACGATRLIGKIKTKYLKPKSVMKFQRACRIDGTAEPGQLLEFDRPPGYGHYALYLGDGKVMHIVIYSKVLGKGKIKEAILEDVCNGDEVRIRNHDKIALKKFNLKPKSPQEILDSARAMQNEKVDYNVRSTNCEYYVTLWRYGKGFSTQVDHLPSTDTCEESEEPSI